MNSEPARKTVLKTIAPQFLVDDLEQSVRYYQQQLGFKLEFTYDAFYASVSRDGFSIHLKAASKTRSDRLHRKSNQHLDAHVDVRGIELLFEELSERGAIITETLATQPWQCRDFTVEDIDGYILCFSEVLE